MRKKIKVLIHGGLGNQLFQYAAGKALHKFKKNYELQFVLNDNLWSKKSVNLDFYLDVKNYKKNFDNGLINRIKNRFFSSINSFVVKDQFSLLKIENVLNNNFSYTLDGYFQNKSWYENSIHDVISEILEKSNKSIISKYHENDLTISFRRSDYTKLGWEINFDYYIKSIECLNKKKEKKITIISEDINFIEVFTKLLKREGYKVSNNFYKNSKIKFPKSVFDFCNIIKSKYLIMSNSSFCWWAAKIRSQLGYDDKNVICPKNWYPKFEKNLSNSHPGKNKKWKIILNSFI